MSNKPIKTPRKPTKLRTQKAIEMTLDGHTQKEIAAELGVDRSTVSVYVNSEQAKEILRDGESRLKRLISGSIDVIEHALKVNVRAGDLTNSLKAALAILKSEGLVKEKAELTHTFPKPYVIEKSDGTQVVLGAKKEDEE